MSHFAVPWATARICLCISSACAALQPHLRPILFSRCNITIPHRSNDTSVVYATTLDAPPRRPVRALWHNLSKKKLRQWPARAASHAGIPAPAHWFSQRSTNARCKFTGSKCIPHRHIASCKFVMWMVPDSTGPGRRFQQRGCFQVFCVRRVTETAISGHAAAFSCTCLPIWRLHDLNGALPMFVPRHDHAIVGELAYRLPRGQLHRLTSLRRSRP